MQNLHAIAIAMLTLGLPALAVAQPAAAANAEADALFDQGRELMDAGKFAEACSAFDASQKASPAVSTLLNLAQCREKNHQFASAYGLFREAARQTRAPGDEITEKLNRVANDRARLLEPKLSRLAIVVAENRRVDRLEVRRDAALVDPGAWNHPLPIDGGVYVITAQASGYLPWTTSIEIAAERDRKTVEVPRLEAAPIPEPLPVPVARSKTVPMLVAGGAVTLLGSALGSELWSRRDYDRSRLEPDDARQASLFHSAKTKQYVAQGLAVVGLGAAGVAVWLYLRGDHGERASPIARIGKFEVEPAVAADRAGLQLTRRY
jgi:tetratricopeptide (TPR) repeat protein